MSLFVEDLIEFVAGYGQWIFSAPQIKLKTPFEEKFIHSVASQLQNGNGLTEKQAQLACRILASIEVDLVNYLGPGKVDLIKPQYRLPIRTINLVKKVVVDNSVNPSILKVYFPYNEALVGKIKEFKKNKRGFIAEWNMDNKCWHFLLTEDAIRFINTSIVPEGFEADDEFKDYAQQIADIERDVEQLTPLLTLVDGKPVFKNTHPTIPQPEDDNIIKALFLARKYGITIDDPIIEHADYQFASPVARALLKTYNHIWVDKREHGIETFKEVIDYAKPLLVVIPGGNEHEYIQSWHKLLNHRGITNEEISVMFRLPNEGKGDFNTYVRDNHLNNELTENTKVVFISVKVPKPIIKANIKFDAIINLGYYMNTHYSLETLLRSVPTLIFYTDQEPKITNHYYGYR